MGLLIEEGGFYLSRAYVPLAIFVLYRRGMFDQSFSSSEVVSMLKIMITMHFIDLAGHALMRYYTKDIVDEYVNFNENPILSQRKILDEYLIQKNYFKSKKTDSLKELKM